MVALASEFVTSRRSGFVSPMQESDLERKELVDTDRVIAEFVDGLWAACGEQLNKFLFSWKETESDIFEFVSTFKNVK